MNIEVVSFFQISQPAPNQGLIDPKPVLSAIAQLTGAVDSRPRSSDFRADRRQCGGCCESDRGSHPAIADRAQESNSEGRGQ